MAIIENYLGMRIRGKIGKQFTVYQRLGKTVMRSVPEDFHPTGQGQLAQQKRIKGCNTFYKAMQAVGLTPYWQQAKKPAGWSGFNLFMSRNLPAFSAWGWIEAPEKIHLTVGENLKLPDSLTLECEKGETDKWLISWEETTYYPKGHPNDRPVVAVMRGGKYFDVKFITSIGDARRKDKRMEFLIPKNLYEYGHIYIFFQSEDGVSVSSSKYLGILS